MLDKVEQKPIESRLMSSENRGHDWLENSPVCTKIIDLDFNLQYMSHAGIEGLKIDDVTECYGKPYPFHFFPDSSKKTMIENLEKVKKTGETINAEATAFDVEGNELWFDSTLTPVYTNDGIMDYILVVSVDTTKRKQAEVRLKLKNKEIAEQNKKYGELNVDLQHANAELIKAKEKAEESGKGLKEAHSLLERRVKERTIDLKKANQELRELAYTLSHDLKSPLRGISTLSDWLYSDNKSSLNKQSVENLELLKSRVTMLFSLIEGIFNYSKIEEVSTEFEDIDMNTIAIDVVNMFDIPDSMNLIIEKDLPVIPAVRIHMIQVLQNLISNAIKYNDKEQGIIQIGCNELSQGWEFYIKDNGMGIAEKYFDRVFKIFQTLQSKKEADSTGIGLAIANKIVEIYNGKIRIESKIGDGSTFYFTIPYDTINQKESTQ
ncbi:MAG: PAS domain-containing protein [Cytophagales bacterium]|nr:PAS domain-containing protein [Cytophagales bacterium]